MGPDHRGKEKQGVVKGGETFQNILYEAENLF